MEAHLCERVLYEALAVAEDNEAAYAELIADAQQVLLEMLAPMRFDATTHAGQQVEESLERLCIQLELRGFQDAGALSLWAFYQRIQFLENKHN